MIWIDWLFIAAILLSALGSFVRGALREIIALAAWLLGAYVAFIYSAESQLLLEPYIKTPEFRYAIVFLTILIIFLVLGAVLGILLSRMIHAIGLTSLDKSLGIIFGLARGVLVIMIFIMVAQFTTLPKSDWWGTSIIIPKLQKPADELLTYLEKSPFWPSDTLKPNSVLELVPMDTKKPETPAKKPEAPAKTAPHMIGPPESAEVGSLVPVSQ